MLVSCGEVAQEEMSKFMGTGHVHHADWSLGIEQNFQLEILE